ncbi:class I SAM-dependent methyltransferase [Agrobacterium rhizogenes]|nr:class I SAM-dependent methyltransferase [Rhizobium rhizogenes]
MSKIEELLGAKRHQTIADIGCFGWNLAKLCQEHEHSYIGIDRVEPPGRPSQASFRTMDGHKIHIEDDSADLTIASHVIEHLLDPVAFAVELARITRPGGLIYIEAPSELSAFEKSDDDVEAHGFDSFWDDPTHIRPFPPGALYRLAISVGVVPAALRRDIAGTIPVVCLVARVPFSGSLGSRYVSFKDVAPGLESAYQAIWPERPLSKEEASIFKSS